MNSKTKILAIYGSGGLGRTVLDSVNDINRYDPQWKKIIFINDFDHDGLINNTEVFTFGEIIEKFSKDDVEIVIAVGEPKVRKILRDKVVEAEINLRTIIHPKAYVSESAKIGAGSVILFGAYIACNVVLCDNVFVALNSTVGHDNVVGSDSIIVSNVGLCGNITIGERTFIGANATVKEKITIGSDVVIGMGSAVFRDIPDKTVTMGNPARIITNNNCAKVFK